MNRPTLKTCIKCKIDKDLSEFQGSCDKYRIHSCKRCLKQYRDGRKEQKKVSDARWRNENKERLTRENREYQRVHKEERCQKSKDKRQRNLEMARTKDRANYHKYREKILARDKERHGQNPDKIREYRRNYARKRRKEPQVKIKGNLRVRIRTALMGICKSAKTEELLGCSYEQFVTYFGSLFTEGMTWERFMKSEIHIDHIIPCAAFDLTDPEQQKVCFNWKNTQPLWKMDNLKKIAQDRAIIRKTRRERLEKQQNRFEVCVTHEF